MEEAFTFALAAPFITVVVALFRAIIPELKGRLVPPAVLVLTIAWGAVLVQSGRFTGDLAEFIVATVVVAAAAIGLNSATSSLAKTRPPTG